MKLFCCECGAGKKGEEPLLTIDGGYLLCSKCLRDEEE